MSVAEFPSRIAQPTDERINVIGNRRRLSVTVEQAAYLALFALALLTHFWGLGDRALHHDETHHAFYSWLLYTGHGYIHDPLLHGPFLYYVNALIYFLFGDNNTTARVGVALFSSIVVVLPYLIRRELGRGAALLASVYLLISPTFLYVGRFIRHDTYAVTFELLAFIGIIRYTSTHRTLWLYLTAAALALMFTTMETFFLYVAIFGSLLVLIFLWRVWRPGIILASALGLVIIALVFVLPGKPLPGTSGEDTAQRAHGAYICPSLDNPSPPDNPIVAKPGPIFGLGPLATADNDYALCVRNDPDNNLGLYFIKLGQFFGHPAILMAIGLSIIGIGLSYFFIWWRRGPDGLTTWQRARAENESIVETFASLATDRRILVAIAIFFSLYALFFSAFLTNPSGIVSGTTGSLLYWLAQHNVQRGNQPGYYYLVMLAIYEPLALIWSTIGIVMVGFLIGKRLLRRQTGDPLEDETTNTARIDFPAGPLHWRFAMPVILVWWAITTVLIYSWAGEKMPWLTMHVALPLVLLGAWALARALRWSFASEQVGGQHADESNVVGTSTDKIVEPAEISWQSGGRRTRAGWRPLLIYLLAFAGISAYGFVQLSNVTSPDRGLQNATLLVMLLTLTAIAIITILFALVRGGRRTVGAVALAFILIGGLYTVRSAYQLSYRWGDVPREMMIFTQTSPDVARVMNQLEQASVRHTSGMGMPIWYDNETVWKWYTRRFTKAQEQPQALTAAPGDDVMAVLMLQENLDNYPQNLQNLKGFLIQRYPLRWWFPEDQTYRLPPDWKTAPVTPNSSMLMRLLRNPTDSTTIAQIWQFLVYRQLPTSLGSTDFVLAVRPAIADEIGLGTGADIGQFGR